MPASDLFSETPPIPETITFEPTRRAGLERLEKFASRTGAHYASHRNFDYGPDNRSSVSALSPWISSFVLKISRQQIAAYVSVRISGGSSHANFVAASAEHGEEGVPGYACWARSIPTRYEAAITSPMRSPARAAMPRPTGADLTGASLVKAAMQGVVLCNTTMTDGSLVYSGC
jgi:hypothetical protein